MTNNDGNGSKPFGPAEVEERDDDTPMDVLRNILAVSRNTNQAVHRMLAKMESQQDGKQRSKLGDFEKLLTEIRDGVVELPDEIERKIPAPLAEELLKHLNGQAAEGGGVGGADGAGEARN